MTVWVKNQFAVFFVPIGGALVSSLVKGEVIWATQQKIKELASLIRDFPYKLYLKILVIFCILGYIQLFQGYRMSKNLRHYTGILYRSYSTSISVQGSFKKCILFTMQWIGPPTVYKRFISRK